MVKWSSTFLKQLLILPSRCPLLLCNEINSSYNIHTIPFHFPLLSLAGYMNSHHQYRSSKAAPVLVLIRHWIQAWCTNKTWEGKKSNHTNPSSKIYLPSTCIALYFSGVLQDCEFWQRTKVWRDTTFVPWLSMSESLSLCLRAPSCFWAVPRSTTQAKYLSIWAQKCRRLWSVISAADISPKSHQSIPCPCCSFSPAEITTPCSESLGNSRLAVHF